jgi:hypothetical protein
LRSRYFSIVAFPLKNVEVSKKGVRPENHGSGKKQQPFYDKDELILNKWGEIMHYIFPL